MSGGLLEIRDLSLAIHGEPILERVSLSVAPGEILGVIGESGSGKSMTALATMGLAPEGAEADGAIALEGQELLGLPERALCALRGRAMGMVFQEPMTALNPLETIGAQVAETLRIHGAGASAMDRAAAALRRVGLAPEAVPLSRYPHELSGGQRQRVVIAIATALKPRLLIADEPTTALDVTTQAQVIALLTALAKEDGAGLLLISHDLAVVAGAAHRIAVMERGRVVETGTTEALLRQRRHPYTETLFAASRHRVSLPPAPPPQPLLAARGVIRDYPGPRRSLWRKRSALRAVDGVSFEVRRGERVGIVGESGCGKSTLARAVLGLEAIQGGAITLGGAPVFDQGRPNPEIRRRAQIVFQDPYGSFNPRHRVSRLVAEPFYALASPPSGPARAQAVAAALEAVGLEARDAAKYIHEFSGGQRQRIAIARALIIEPELIVFDEAVSALDVSIRAQILDLIAELCRRRPLSTLFISHDLSVVETVTDRVLVMRAGRIVEEGPTARVFAAPAHPYTQALIAAAPRLPEAAAALAEPEQGAEE